jgi:hypothetical protein
MFEITNATEVGNELDAWLMAVEEMATEVGRGLSVAAFNYALEIGPQYSGDFVANLRYSINVEDKTFDVGRFEIKRTARPEGYGVMDIAKIAGDPEAIGYARMYNAGRAAGFKLGDTVYISSSAEHDEPYAIKIENNEIKFRPGNHGQTFGYTALDIGMRYENIDAAKAETLKRERL